MRPLAILGIILIALGAVALAYQGITYTTKEKVVDLGPLKVETEKEKTIPLPPVLGGVAIVVGLVLLIASSRGRGSSAPARARAGRGSPPVALSLWATPRR